MSTKKRISGNGASAGEKAREAFRKRLREIIVQSDMSQREIASKVGMSVTTLNELIRPGGPLPNPTLETIVSLADALGVHVAHLLSDDLMLAVPAEVIPDQQALERIIGNAVSDELTYAVREGLTQMLRELVATPSTTELTALERENVSLKRLLRATERRFRDLSHSRGQTPGEVRARPPTQPTRGTSVS